MKRAFTRYYTYLIGVALATIPTCIAIISYFAISDTAVWPYEYIKYTFLFSTVVLFGIGFIIQDLYRARIRHKTKNWAEKLPEQNLDTAWSIFSPFIIASIITLILGLIFHIRLF